jgi:predicted PurR-regulated permease PerM
MNAEDRAVRRKRAAAEWADLVDRLRTVTPRDIGRTTLVVAVLAIGAMLATSTWPALAPFAVGGIVAYAVLPLVDGLDRFMPRALAAVLAVVSVLVAFGVVVALIVPPLTVGLVRFAVDLPTEAEVAVWVADLREQLAAPEGSEAVIEPIIAAVAVTIRDAFAGAGGGLDDIVRGVVTGLVNAVGALIGLIVLPTWMLTMMTEKRRARTAIDQRIAPWLRRDLWAIASIADRAAGAYLRGYVVVGLIVGSLAYIGAVASPRLGGPTFQEPLALGAIAGASQVIPIVGPLLGLLPALLLLPIDPNRAVAYLAIYLGARLLGSTLIGSRLAGRRINVHPAILVPGVVVVGQFGIVWLLLSAPIVAGAVDLVRYAHGRLSEPPRPAGVLPREPGPRVPAVQRASIVRHRRPTAPAPLRRAPQTEAAQ